MKTAPRLTHRPSYAQREAYREALSDAYAEGRLNDAEFAARSARVDSAHMLRDLENLVADVPREGIPVPLKTNQVPGNGAGGRPGGGPAGTSGPRTPGRPVVVSGKHAAPGFSKNRLRGMAKVYAVVALLVGLGAGIAAFSPDSGNKHGSDTDGGNDAQAAGKAAGQKLDESAVNGFMSYGYIKGMLDALGDKRVVGIEFSPTQATAQIVQPGGAVAYRTEFDKDLKRSRHDDSGSKFTADSADLVSFGANDLKPAVLYAIVVKAPKLLAKRADRNVDPATLRTSRVSIQRNQGPVSLGQKKRGIIISANVSQREHGRSFGLAEWSANGKDLLAVSLS